MLIPKTQIILFNTSSFLVIKSIIVVKYLRHGYPFALKDVQPLKKKKILFVNFCFLIFTSLGKLDLQMVPKRPKPYMPDTSVVLLVQPKVEYYFVSTFNPN